MANRVEAIRPTGPVTPAPSMTISRSKGRRRIFVDRLVGRLVTLGGVIIIASILAILLVIVAGVYPLFRKPTAEIIGPARGVAAKLHSAPLAVGVDEYREIAYVVAGDEVQFLALDEAKPLKAAPLQGLNGATAVVTSMLGKGSFAVGLSDGRVIPVTVKFTISFPG
jgi:phosphate transport system permease protein